MIVKPRSKRPAPEVAAREVPVAAAALEEAEAEPDGEENAERTFPVAELEAAEEPEELAELAEPSCPLAAARTVLLNLPDMPSSLKRAEKAMTG